MKKLKAVNGKILASRGDGDGEDEADVEDWKEELARVKRAKKAQKESTTTKAQNGSSGVFDDL